MLLGNDLSRYHIIKKVKTASFQLELGGGGGQNTIKNFKTIATRPHVTREKAVNRQISQNSKNIFQLLQNRRKSQQLLDTIAKSPSITIDISR